ncbi:ankyrin repeat domain-containing protein [Streptomyces sp. LUP47B]|uniref:ankyrin repeat domain-containing protein n=1 Tax=Streptomyces sp. LUP47B TaxID=1890286 RepID=UPI00210BF08A|nr:ankyrin repeat domain-containing protein [Streptomyces sp. LUP47B]
MHGHTEAVRVLLGAGAPTCAQGRLGYVPIVLAATSGDHGHPQTVDLLLNHGTDIDAVMKDRTSLEWAALIGQVQMVHHLLARGATPEGTGGGTPPRAAVPKGRGAVRAHHRCPACRWWRG